MGSSDEGEQFDAAGAGASLVYPLQAGALKKGGHVMIKGKPCKSMYLLYEDNGSILLLLYYIMFCILDESVKL